MCLHMYSNQKDSSHHKKCTCWVARAFPLTSTWYHRTNIRCPHVQTYCVPSRVTLEKLTRHVPPTAEGQSNPCLLPRRKSPCGSDANRFNEFTEKEVTQKCPFLRFLFSKRPRFRRCLIKVNMESFFVSAFTSFSLWDLGERTKRAGLFGYHHAHAPSSIMPQRYCKQSF